ncbi:unnamed protein product, partial [Bubo scandiacus]
MHPLWTMAQPSCSPRSSSSSPSERKFPALPPPPPAPSRLCPPRQAPAQIPRRAKPRRDRADPTWEPGTHTHTSRPPAGDPACPSRPASGTPISALPREGGRGAASRCVGLQGFGGGDAGAGGPAGCPWAAPSPVSVCGEALRGGGRSGATRSPCGPQPPAGSRLPSSPLRWRKIQPQPGTAPASPREGRRGAAAAESPLRRRLGRGAGVVPKSAPKAGGREGGSRPPV